MKTMAKHPGLMRRGSRWYLRAKVAADLVEEVGRREIWRGLETGSHRKAVGRYHQVRGEVQALLEAARRRLRGGGGGAGVRHHVRGQHGGSRWTGWHAPGPRRPRGGVHGGAAAGGRDGENQARAAGRTTLIALCGILAAWGQRKAALERGSGAGGSCRGLTDATALRRLVSRPYDR